MHSAATADQYLCWNSSYDVLSEVLLLLLLLLLFLSFLFSCLIYLFMHSLVSLLFCYAEMLASVLMINRMTLRGGGGGTSVSHINN